MLLSQLFFLLSTRWMVKYPSYDCWGPTIRHEVGKSVWIFRFSSRFFLSWKLLVPDPWGHHRRHQGYMPWACLKVELPKILPCFIISHDIAMISPFSWVLLHPHTPTELGWLDHVISHRFWGKILQYLDHWAGLIFLLWLWGWFLWRSHQCGTPELEEQLLS